MKFNFLLPLLLFIAICANAAPSSRRYRFKPLHITSPARGSTLIAGSAVTMAWTTPILPTPNYKVNLLKGTRLSYSHVATLYTDFHFPYVSATVYLPQGIAPGSDYMLSIGTGIGRTTFYGPLRIAGSDPTQTPV
ncbi:hypothetical protein PHYBLDRAFT_63571 [Phycomyces blakesleeanus NRRL 1555(-)]|uniref:Uncharacterized protein n=2 Tax=Phycomyces blakesleeanus TaxID=4837 RepID=A0A167J565_PHYB8|nr:hypothetical protein PHYBLDRAFT_63571 [Phycomyces blakesleeanus NRRL 1555(-)]OAD65177.1 hypothetical protein PHYBLDRAFT_63571 [Phycomyces blakesleeanus NRRL 1555(-)]|eukprot:XP_018283217.1 hypothetical protein PHYBLDRAFT_63571 [Phycomyces blakesleeanus NRRL 1555(-)]